MAKSRGRKFAEITSPSSGVFDLTSVPTITNAKLQNSAMTLAGSSVSLGGTGVADTDALSEGSSNLYFTNARVQSFLGGGTLAGNVVVPDNRSIYLGSNSDFRLVHNTTNTQLINATGALQVTSNGGFDVTGAATFSAGAAVTGAISSTSEIRNIGSSGSASNRLKLTYDSTNGTALIGPDSNGGSTTLALGTSNSGTYANALTIANDGDVGIGVPTPDQKLMVKGTIETVATNSANGWQLYTYTDNTFRVNYNGAGADEVIIDSGGDVTFAGDISLLSDSKKIFLGASSDLEIYHDGSNNVINSANSHSLRIAVGGTNQWEFHPSSIFKGNDGKKIILGDSSDLQLYHDGSNSYVKNSTAALILDTSHVNIAAGVTNTQTTWPLQVSYSNNNGAHAGIQVSNQNTGTTSNWAGLSAHAVNGGVQSFFYSADYDTWGVGLFAGTGTNHPFHLFSNNTERMRIHTNGAVSIANTRNYYGALNVEAGVISTNASGLDVKASGTDKQIISFGDHNSISGELRLTNNVRVTLGTSSNHPFTFYTNGVANERMRILANGHVGIGVAGADIGSGWNRVVHIHAAGGSGSHLRFTDNNTGSTGDSGLFLGQYQSDSYFINRENGRQYFYVNNTIKMLLSAAGNLGLGTNHEESRRGLGIKSSSPGIHFVDTDVTNLRHEIIGGGNAGLEISADYNNVGTGYIRFDIGGNNFHKFHEGGSILNRHVNSTQGRHFFVGTVSAWSNGNRYVHVQLSTSANAMLCVHVFGYSYLQGLIEGMGAGYNYNNANQTAMYNNYKNGSVVAMHQNTSNSYSEVVIDTVGTGTSNRWGAIAIYATDDLGQSDKIEIVQYAFNASTARLYT